jgi:Protein of unknown function (DUF3685)
MYYTNKRLQQVILESGEKPTNNFVKYNLIYSIKMKMQYWPGQQGIELNREVSKLFQKLYLKFNYNLYNRTPSILSIDIVNIHTKKEIFKIIVLELEILVLDIIELDLSIDDLHQLNQKILFDLINKSMASFILSRINFQDLSSRKGLKSLKINGEILSNHQFLLQNLLTYLIFGNPREVDKPCIFEKKKIPVKYIEILLDSLIIQLADIIFSEIIRSQESLSKLFTFLISNKICNNRYISIQSISTFRNNLLWSNFIGFYVRQPTMIYNNHYQVWLFSSTGLQSQYIYQYREKDLNNLSNTQIIIVALLELQDFILPKIKNLIFLIVKVGLSVFSNIINHGLDNILQNIILVRRAKNKSS